MPYVDTDTGEVFAECPACEQTRRDAEVQITSMEREMRSLRAARSRAENLAAKAEEYKRDGKVWKQALAHWEATFPEKRVTSKGIKSARATAFFQRLEAGAGPEDVDDAVTAAREYPYVVFGKRRRTSTKDDLAIDLQQIVSVGNDAQFDFLVEAGRAIREAKAKEELF